jgi:glycosyltransferase involved in cell wall biosynthesis
MKLSIIVPAHNEEARIARMLEAYLPYFTEHYAADVEIVVVLNACTDGTERVISEFVPKFPCLRWIEESRPGKGQALMTGFAAAEGELVGFTDADGSTPPQAFQDLVDRIGDAGCIIASRWRDDSIVSPRQPLDRRIASRCFNFMVRILFGLRLTDTQCGAKLIRREPLRAVLPCLGLTRWAFDVDLLFQLRRQGHRTIETATEWHDVAGSKIDVLHSSIDMFCALTRLRLLYSPFKGIVTVYNKLRKIRT